MELIMSNTIKYSLKQIMAALSLTVLAGSSGAVLAACPDYAKSGQKFEFSAEDAYSAKTYTIEAGGNLDLSQCAKLPGEGWVTEAPDFTFKLTANPKNRAIEFKVTSKCDSVLLINTPTSKWQFDDDSNGALDPKVRIPSAATGYYDIWIGNTEKGYCDATLKVETF
jgi:hypothetical protein